MIELVDHNGQPAHQHRVQANGIKLYAVSAGKRPALLLIPRTHKTHIYRRKLLPLLTTHFRVMTLFAEPG